MKFLRTQDMILIYNRQADHAGVVVVIAKEVYIKIIWELRKKSLFYIQPKASTQAVYGACYSFWNVS